MKTALPIAALVSATLVAMILAESLVARNGGAQATVGLRYHNFVFRDMSESATPPPTRPLEIKFSEPMAAPRDLRITGREATRLFLEWSPAIPPAGRSVARYEVFRNGLRVGMTGAVQTEVAFNPFGVDFESFAVHAIDDQGHASLRSQPVIAPHGEPAPVTLETKVVVGLRRKLGFAGLRDGVSIFRAATYTGRVVSSTPDTSFDWGTVNYGKLGTTDIQYAYSSTVAQTGGQLTNGWGRIVRTGFFLGQYLDGVAEDLPASGDPGGDSPGIVAVPLALVYPGTRVVAGDSSAENSNWRVDRDERDSNGSGVFRREEIVYVGEVTEAEIDAGAEADLRLAELSLASLDWGQSYVVSAAHGEFTTLQSEAIAGRAFPDAIPHSSQRLMQGLYRFRIGGTTPVPPPGSLPPVPPMPPFGPADPPMPGSVPLLPSEPANPLGLGSFVMNLRWAEVLTPADGSTPRVLNVREELVKTNEGVGWTSAYYIEAPSEAGTISAVLLPVLGETRALAIDPAPGSIAAGDSMLAGQAVEIALLVPTGWPAYTANPDAPVMVNVSGNAVQLIAIDPAVERSFGLSVAIARGEVIGGGTNLKTHVTASGLRYGEWKLVAVGLTPGKANISISFDAEGQTATGRTLTVLPTVALGVDANRDGLIANVFADNPDATSRERPFRFWINDDIDRLHHVDEEDSEQDDIGGDEALESGWNADWLDNGANALRDLEDFARLVIQLRDPDLEMLRSGEVFLGMRWSDLRGTPALRLYANADPSGSADYLTTKEVAAVQYEERGILDARTPNGGGIDAENGLVAPGRLHVLPAGFWSREAHDASVRSLLFEACAAGSGRLELVLLRPKDSDFVEVATGGGVWLDLKDVTEFYEHWTVGNASGGAPAEVAARLTPTEFDADNPEERKYILFVHGWNVERWEKERFAETAFKRLYWQGYRGGFGLFSWPCTNGFGEIVDAVLDGSNFDRGEHSAWRSAKPLGRLMETLHSAYDGELYVLSHSMGGIVVSEALRLRSDAGGGQIAKVYVASQAAITAHTFDGTLSESAGSDTTVKWTYAHPSFKVGEVGPGELTYGPQTPNIYRQWFGFLLGGGASSKSVGALINFYNQNDWALSEPNWMFNQLKKTDWPDPPDQPWNYAYTADPTSFDDAFATFDVTSAIRRQIHLGTRTDPKDRYEIMAFAAEARVRALGALNLSKGVSRSVPLPEIWPDGVDGDYSDHKWHSAEFRSSIQLQDGYWKTLLGSQGFGIHPTARP